MLQTTIKDTNRTALDTLYSIRNVLAPEAMTALYCRLSVDDANDGDSNSIQNQKKILLNYARENGYINTQFFVDDGYSGTSFERPSFKKMIEGIKSGEIKRVIIKDMSRFGRDYLQVGMYTEIMFAEYDIHFVAVNDGVDSQKGENDLTPFRNLFNEWYARDCSKKQRAVKRMKGMSGERISSHAPYGYIKGEGGKLLVDEETAPVVKLIFDLRVEGLGVGRIASELTRRNIPTPGTIEYRRTGKTRRYLPHAECVWSAATITMLLKHKEYLGHTVNFKTFSKSYNTAKQNLYNYVNNEIVPEFEKISDVAEVAVSGGAEEYIRIELVEEKVKQYGVSMTSIAGDIGSANLSYPAGSTKVGSQELSLSTKMDYDTIEALKDIPLTTGSSHVVYLADVANIYKTSNAGDSIARYNGEDTVSLQITKQQSSTAMALSSAVRRVIRSLTRQDEDLRITVVDDSAESIKSSLMSVVETLVLAIIISMVVIWLFLGDLKASLIVGSSIPVSILVCLICMAQMGLTLNIITLCALTLGVGMMVDNSIVVLESCFRVTDSRPSGFLEYMRDALEGTQIVGASVMASTITTCVVFLPLAMLKGMTGQLLGPLGYTIVFSMAASLLSAVSVVPLCYMLYRPKEKEHASLSAPIHHLQNWYRRAMLVILPKKKTVVLLSVLLLVAAFKLAGQLKMELMASDDNGQISISIETRPGLVTAKIDEIVRQAEEILVQHEDLEAYMTTSGGSGMMSSGSASITAYLKDDRKMDTTQVAAQWKRELQDITNCNITVDVSGSMSMMSSFGNSFETIIQGADYDEVKEVSDRIVSELMERPEVTKVHSDVENSSPVVEVTVDGAKAKAAGLTASSIGSTLSQMVSGIEAADLDIDGENVTVKVEYPEGTYETLDQIKGIVLSAGNGNSVLLTDVAQVGFHDSPASIRREEKQYKVTISAEYTEHATAMSQMTLNQEVIEPNLTDTVTTGLNSMDQSMNEEFSAIFGAIATAIFLIFVVMAMQFESLKFSLMVMVTIPFSLIGSFGMLWLADSAISMISLVGFLMLVGTVVNAGILYVDTVNQYRNTMDRDTALIEAGATRMRPILMTTLTTIIAMIPMAFGWGSSGEMTKGLALVNIGGLTASTILSLLLLPVFYGIISRTPKKEPVRKGEDE